MEKSTFRRYGILSQVVIFIIFFLINFIESYAPGYFLESMAFASNYTFMVLAVTAIHYKYLLRLYLEKNRLLYFILLIGLMTVFIALNFVIYASLPFIPEDEPFSEWIKASDIAYDYLVLMIAIALTSLYYFVEQWFKNISTESQLRNEKLQAELNFLKSQINPHFLFNTLNNIYSFAQTGNEKTAPMLERLSSILRFMVYDCEENRVVLTKEINAVKDLLEILKMKNSEQRNIDLKVEGVKGFHLIAPLIIVNFVENACKHSNVVSNPNGFIKVAISIDDSDVCKLDVSNTYNIKPVENTRYGGIGLENIKKRLELQYHEKYSLTEERSDGIYLLRLTVPLERKS